MAIIRLINVINTLVIFKLKKQAIHTLTLILLSLIINCKPLKRFSPSSEIIEIYNSSKCGDKGGKFSSLQIRKDSTILISNTRNLTDTLKNITDPVIWDKMVKLLNVKDFEKFASSSIGNLPSNCISTFAIKTKDTIITKSGIIFNNRIEESVTINDLIIKTSW